MGISAGEVATASDVRGADNLRSRYAWGTFSGDGTASRNITTGWLCAEAVVHGAGGIFALTTVNNDSIYIVTNTVSAGALIPHLKLSSSDGFIVASTMNASTSTYDYTAFSRA